MIRSRINRRRLTAWMALIALFAMPISLAAQTQIKYHSNKYKIQDDVQLGRQAAAEAADAPLAAFQMAGQAAAEIRGLNPLQQDHVACPLPGPPAPLIRIRSAVAGGPRSPFDRIRRAEEGERGHAAGGGHVRRRCVRADEEARLSIQRRKLG